MNVKRGLRYFWVAINKNEVGVTATKTLTTDGDE